MAKKPKQRKIEFVSDVDTIGRWYTTYITGAAIIFNAAQTAWIVLQDDPLVSGAVWGSVNIVLLALNQFANTLKQDLQK